MFFFYLALHYVFTAKNVHCTAEVHIHAGSLLSKTLAGIIIYVRIVFGRISDHLYAMFEVESPSWDVERKYRLANLEVCDYGCSVLFYFLVLCLLF